MESVPLTGTQYEIRAGALQAVVTAAGGALRELHDGDRPLVEGFDADELPAGAQGHLLMPWPNRIDRGRYSFDGRVHQLDITEPPRDCAIHGLVRFAPWTAVAHDEHRVVLAHRLHAHQGYPYVLDLEVGYSLDAATGLTVTMSATNRGGRPAPYGHGGHPYLTVGASVDECHAVLPGGVRLESDDRYIPTGPASVEGGPYDFRESRPLRGTALNEAYTDLLRDGDGRAWSKLAGPSGSGSVSLWADESFPWLQVYTGEELPDGLRRRSLAVEPMTCPPNAFVSGDDLIVLDPGQSVSGSWGIVPA